MGHFELFDEKSYDLNKNSKKGILILHGFSSSTYETVPLGKYLSKKVLGFLFLIYRDMEQQLKIVTRKASMTG